MPSTAGSLLYFSDLFVNLFLKISGSEGFNRWSIYSSHGRVHRCHGCIHTHIHRRCGCHDTFTDAMDAIGMFTDGMDTFAYAVDTSVDVNAVYRRLGGIPMVQTNGNQTVIYKVTSRAISGKVSSDAFKAKCSWMHPR